jgi:CubicO group peptidase (beta-lactamase class C family)
MDYQPASTPVLGPLNKKPASAEQILTPSGLTTRQLSDALKAMMKRGGVPAIAIAMVTPTGSHTIVEGFRKYDNITAATTNDSFMVGPVSSTMVPIVLSRLIERGLFSWASTLEELLPELRDEIHPAHHGTTMEMFSAHISGITTKLPELENGQLLADLNSEDINGHDGRRRILRCLLDPPERKPGPGSSYRNAVNLLILAFIAETTTGESWEAIVDREVFQQLRMHQSGIGQPKGLDIGECKSPMQPWPHEIGPDGKTLIPLNSLKRAPWLTCRATYPALGIHSTLSDLITYLQFCLSGTISSDELSQTVLSPASREQLYKRADGSDFTPGGFDIIHTDWASEEVLRCKGHVSGHSTGIWVAPKTGYAFIVIVNVDGPAGASIRDEVYDLMA